MSLEHRDQPSPQPPGPEIRHTEAQGFTNLNTAMVESGIIPRLDQIVRQRGVEPEYWVFDGLEFTMGTPVPVATRYILVVAPETVPDIDNDTIMIGIAAQEWGFGDNSTSISIGISLHEMDKLAQRFHAVYETDGSEPKNIKPDWWVYDFPVKDLTRPPSLVRQHNPRAAIDAFGYGDYDVDRMESLGHFTFDKKRGEGQPRERVWESYQEEVDQTMSKLEDLVDAVVARSRADTK